SFENKLHVKYPGNLGRAVPALMGAIPPLAIVRIIALLKPLDLGFQLLDPFLDGTNAPFGFVSGFGPEGSIPPFLCRAKRFGLGGQASSQYQELILHIAFGLLQAALEKLLL